MKVKFNKTSLISFKSLFKTIGIILFLSQTALTAGKIPETIIKVGILENNSRIHVKSNVYFKAVDIFTLKTSTLKKNQDYVIIPVDGGLKVGDIKFSEQVRFIPGKSNSFVRINGRRYRDTVIVRNENGKLSAINELGLDGYLFGVLPVEVSPKWPIESLKAQAVISRTYVLNNLGKYGTKGYDLSSDIFSQMYRGVEVEKPESNRAVKETRGMVLTRKGELTQAYFFSSCGGHTADIKNVWGNSIPHMRGRTCIYCKDSPRYNWENYVESGTIKQKLNKAGYNIGEITDIKFLNRTSSGRIGYMHIIHSGGKLKISGHKFRMAIGPNIIKSTLMTINRKKQKFFFYGRGWGHAVGMCQWGAKGLAGRGKSYKYILKFYFPGTRVKKWNY